MGFYSGSNRCHRTKKPHFLQVILFAFSFQKQQTLLWCTCRIYLTERQPVPSNMGRNFQCLEQPDNFSDRSMYSKLAIEITVANWYIRLILSLTRHTVRRS